MPLTQQSSRSRTPFTPRCYQPSTNHTSIIIHGAITYRYYVASSSHHLSCHHQDEARFTRSPIIATLNAANPSATLAAARFNFLLRSSSRAARYAASSSAFRLRPATTPARNTRACVVARILIDEEEVAVDDGDADGSGMLILCQVEHDAI